MTRAIQATVLALAITCAVSFLTPSPVLADPGSRQQNKNLWRNLAIGSAAVAGYGLLKHDSTATLLGLAGAAYSANRYEQDRHSQDAAARARARYHRRLIDSRRLRYAPGRYERIRYVPVYHRREGPPYGHAYGYWRHHRHDGER